MPTARPYHLVKPRDNDYVITYTEKGVKYAFLFRSLMKAKSVYNELWMDPNIKSVKFSQAEVNNGVITYHPPEYHPLNSEDGLSCGISG